LYMYIYIHMYVNIYMYIYVHIGKGCDISEIRKELVLKIASSAAEICDIYIRHTLIWYSYDVYPPEPIHNCCSLPDRQISQKNFTHRSVQIRMNLSEYQVMNYLYYSTWVSHWFLLDHYGHAQIFRCNQLPGLKDYWKTMMFHNLLYFCVMYWVGQIHLVCQMFYSTLMYM